MKPDELDAALAKFFGQLTAHFNEHLNTLESKIDSKADAERVYKALDSIASRLNTDD